ncbi:MAG: AAA family ATPase [Candidatus Bipolaricaulota bacterium]|nr:AAA family ATPase [Candidatus Bipolaricaulota bacterium]
MTEPRRLPRDEEAEKAILGTLLLGPQVDALPVVEKLRPEDFTHSRDQVLFRTMKEMHADGLPTDTISVANRLDELGLTEKVGGRLRLSELRKYNTIDAQVLHYTQIVHDKALRRSVITASTELTELAYDERQSVKELLARSQEVIDGLTTTSIGREVFSPCSIASLLEQGVPPRDDVIAGVLPKGGILLVLGSPKDQKTIFCLNLAVAVARGEPFLGWETIAGPVLYLTGEGGVGLVTERLAKMLPDDARPPIFPWHPQPGAEGIKLDNAAARRRIIRFAHENGVVLIVIDPLYLFHDRDENSSKEMRPVIDGLLNIGQETGASIVLVHYKRKSGQGARAGSAEEARGTSALHGIVSASLVLEHRQDGLAVHHEFRHTPSPPPQLLSLDEATLTFIPQGILTHGNRKLDSEKLLGVIAADGPLGLKEMEKLTGCKGRTISGYLKCLETERRITYERDAENRKVWKVITADGEACIGSRQNRQ